MAFARLDVYATDGFWLAHPERIRQVAEYYDLSSDTRLHQRQRILTAKTRLAVGRTHANKLQNNKQTAAGGLHAKIACSQQQSR